VAYPKEKPEPLASGHGQIISVMFNIKQTAQVKHLRQFNGSVNAISTVR
jgi:hypothetical protein